MKTVFLIMLTLTFFHVGAYAADTLPEYTAVVDSGGEAGFNEIYEVGTSDMCSLGCAIGWDVEVSSYLPSNDTNKYGPKTCNDFDLSTAWVEGKPGYGIGESVTFNFPEKYFIGNTKEEGVDMRGFMVFNGYAKNDAVWRANARVKRFKLYLNDTPLYIIRLQDTKFMQNIAFPQLIIYPGARVKLEIMEVYTGDKYKDTAISEIEPQGAH